MINANALDMYSDAHPLHPQVLIKIKEQALGGFLSEGLEILNLNKSNDYFDDCAALYDFLFEKEAENLEDEEFENSGLTSQELNQPNGICMKTLIGQKFGL